MEVFSACFVLKRWVCSLGRITSLDMATAVQHLSEPDPELQVLGAAYIQHECYNDSDAKVAVGNQTNLLVPKAYNHC